MICKSGGDTEELDGHVAIEGFGFQRSEIFIERIEGRVNKISSTYCFQLVLRTGKDMALVINCKKNKKTDL